jgi:hypothetical protein
MQDAEHFILLNKDKACFEKKFINNDIGQSKFLIIILKELWASVRRDLCLIFLICRYVSVGEAVFWLNGLIIV